MKKIHIYGFIAVVVLGGVLFFLFGGGNGRPEAGNLQIEDIEVGSGGEAKSGYLVTVDYVGYLTDGRKFDSSYDRGEPFQFVLGAGQVIQGWDLGVLGMKVGGKRKLTIPPDLGYGNQEIGNGLIPANSTLIFEVEILEIR